MKTQFFLVGDLGVIRRAFDDHEIVKVMNESDKTWDDALSELGFMLEDNFSTSHPSDSMEFCRHVELWIPKDTSERETPIVVYTNGNEWLAVYICDDAHRALMMIKDLLPLAFDVDEE